MFSLCRRRSSLERKLLCALLLAAGSARAQPATGVISGRILFKNDGSQLWGAKVTIDASGSHAETVPDQSGVYRFLNLAPDTYRLTLSHLGMVSKVIEVEIAAGEQREVPDIALPIASTGCLPHPPFYFKLLPPGTRTAAISGSVPGSPETSAEASLYNPQKRYRTVQPDSTGHFTFNDLPPGTYRLWMHRFGFPWIDTPAFDLAPGWEAVYTPPPPLPPGQKPFVCE